MNRKDRAITAEECKEIYSACATGGNGYRANRTILTVFVIEANLGIRLSDIVPYENKTTGKSSTGLRLSDIRYECGRYHLAIKG